MNARSGRPLAQREPFGPGQTSGRLTLARRGLALAAVLCAIAAGSLLSTDDLNPTRPSSVAAQARVVNAADFPSIQAAIDSVQTTGGAVYVPAGNHRVNAKVRVYSNVTVFGAGMDQTVVRFADGVVDHLMSNANLTAGNRNIVVRDLTLAGNGVSSSGCCFGLRLVNVADSFVINVGSDWHSLDGFYLGYNQTRGVYNVRLSSCRATNNGRNGIAITHGSGNAIDNCRVENNNRIERVAGIDLEPDDERSVSDNKVVNNTANGQNVGIQLYAFDRARVTVANNAICTNTANNNTNAGIWDFNGYSNIYVNNSTSGNGNNFLVDPTARIGGEYSGYCQLGSLPSAPSPPGPSTPTRTPTPLATGTPSPTLIPTSCSPRPNVNVSTSPGSAGSLQVTVAVGKPPTGPNNRLHALKFGAATNGVIDIQSQVGVPGNFTVNLPPATAQASFTVRRVTPGVATTVQVVVVDDCGDWPTFVGGGPSAF